MSEENKCLIQIINATNGVRSEPFITSYRAFCVGWEAVKDSDDAPSANDLVLILHEFPGGDAENARVSFCPLMTIDTFTQKMTTGVSANV